ncbi:MAG: hypothetical protein HYR66_14450 [Sphingobacteriales bacterium]|nr:hypothetical protein [Sphingobacteriales bacterium]MBI3719861.1 hypothetical protein [Sphingobacteriales bacterium]
MNTKTLAGGLIIGVLAFLLGWLIFGMLLMNFYQSNTTSYAGLMKDPMEIWAIAVANLAFGLMMAYVFNLGNINTPGKGFTTGLILGLLMTIGFDLFLYSQYHLMNKKLIGVDIAASAVFDGVLGAVLGWWFGRNSKTGS